MYTHIHTHTRKHTLTHTHSSIGKLIYVATRARRFFLFHTQFFSLTHTHAHVVLENVSMNLSARALSHAHLPKVPLNTHNDKHTCIQHTDLKDTQRHMHSVSMSMSASMAASITVYTYYTHCLYLMKKSLDLIQSYPIWYAWLTTQIQVIGWLCITSYDCISNTNPGFHAKRGTHATWYAWLTAMWHASWHMTLIYAWLIHMWSDSFIFVIHSCVTWLMTLRHCMGVV